MMVNLASARGCEPYWSCWFGVGFTKIVDALASDELSKWKFLLLWVCILLRMTLHQPCTPALFPADIQGDTAGLLIEQRIWGHASQISAQGSSQAPSLLPSCHQEGTNLTISISMCISPPNLRANVMLLTLGVLECAYVHWSSVLHEIADFD